jgi:hypothetical protein
MGFEGIADVTMAAILLGNVADINVEIWIMKISTSNLNSKITQSVFNGLLFVSIIFIFLTFLSSSLLYIHIYDG